MRCVLIFIILMVNNILSAQDLRIGVMAQTGLSYFAIQSEFSTLSQNYRQQIKPVVTCQGGILLFKKLSPNLSFVTGLIFSQRGIRSQFNTNNITAFNFSNSGFDVKLIDRYLDVPLLLNIYISQSSAISTFGSFGLKPSLYLNSASKIIGSSGNNSQYYYGAHRKFNLFASVGFGLELTLMKKFSFLIWPSVDHALISEVYAAPVRLYPYSAGINLCFIYSLGN